MYDSAVQFVAHGCLAESNGAGSLPDTVPLVVEYLDFVTFVFGEMIEFCHRIKVRQRHSLSA